MQDLILASVFAGALFLLIVMVSSAIVAQYSGAQVPKLLVGRQYGRGNRKSLIVVLAWAIAIVGSGQLIVVLFLVHPASTIGVRAVSVVELGAAAGWIWYLRRLVSRKVRDHEAGSVM